MLHSAEITFRSLAPLKAS